MPTVISGTDGVSQVQTGAVEVGDIDPSAIVGTVSESSGVPTGAIIERGSNSNGEYIKYADGTMIATGRTNANVVTLSGFHSYRTNNLRPNMPVSFTEEFGAMAGFVDVNPNFAVSTTIDSGQTSFRVFSDTEVNLTVFLTIIGRWY